MPVSGANVETDQIAALELAVGGLHVDHRAALAEADAADDRGGVVPGKARVEFAQHLALGDVFLGDRESRIDGVLGRARPSAG